MTGHQLPAKRTYRRLGKQALNSVDDPAPAAAQVLYTLFMMLDPKEREILAFIAQFKQLSTKQIKALVFPGKLHDPQRRAVKHLKTYKLITEVTEPMRGGPRGGAQMTVWQLGPQGRKMYGRGRGSSTVVDYHLLRIADTYIALAEAHRAKQIKIEHYDTEPDTHMEVGPAVLKPDLFVDIIVRRKDGKDVRRARWIEIDLGTERQKQVLDQVLAYKLAYENKQDYPLEPFPKVLLLAINEERAADITYWMKRAKDLPDIFEVGTLDQVLTILQR